MQKTYNLAIPYSHFSGHYKLCFDTYSLCYQKMYNTMFVCTIGYNVHVILF